MWVIPTVGRSPIPKDPDIEDHASLKSRYETGRI